MYIYTIYIQIANGEAVYTTSLMNQRPLKMYYLHNKTVEWMEMVWQYIFWHK